MVQAENPLRSVLFDDLYQFKHSRVPVLQHNWSTTSPITLLENCARKPQLCLPEKNFAVNVPRVRPNAYDAQLATLNDPRSALMVTNLSIKQTREGCMRVLSLSNDSHPKMSVIRDGLNAHLWPSGYGYEFLARLSLTRVLQNR
ncbi:hypothetical protein TNCV_1929281 [Trichonephila clavipes]|nr:hypothetical protein TNCV_1929281 [Trichonephila clavipes]